MLNRELALIEFNRRVLAQAEDKSLPLLERLKFLCIVSSNMDEFFEVRVAWLKGVDQLTPERLLQDDSTARQTLEQITLAASALVSRQYQILREDILPGLREQGIIFFRRSEWTKEQAEWVREFFFRELMPILTPIGLDPSHPFPRLLNKSLNFAVELEGKDAFGRQSSIAIVQAPRILPRVIELPPHLSNGRYGFVFLSSILHAHVHELFLGMTVKGCYQFRVTRNSELNVEEEDLKNLRTALQGELRQRHFGEAVRLEISDAFPEHMVEFLLTQFGLLPRDLYRVDGPVNLVRLMPVYDLINRPDMKYPPFHPSWPAPLPKKGSDLFATIRRGDILLHHPYQSFEPVIDLLVNAATDPQVVAIKMTVYRTGTDSVLMESLIAAARAGKQVTVVVELMARFDEEANISWASRLEDAGAHVVYGVFGYKIHAKMLMVVRREENMLRRYVHLGTGNYHPRTARQYTDFGLMTCDERIASDVNDIFIQITGLGHAGELQAMYQSPFTLHEMILQAIDTEAEHAKAGRPARIIAKMNALLETQVIQALYAASQAGVKIQLIIRGVCALRPGISGLSENICVRSIVGRFLEHERVYYFHNDGKEDVFLASADWMGRNFFRRIETCIPIRSNKLKRQIIRESLRLYLQDNVNAWDMHGDGSYRRKHSNAHPHCAQQQLLDDYGCN